MNRRTDNTTAKKGQSTNNDQ